MHWQTNRPKEELGGEDKGTLQLAKAISWVWVYLSLYLPFTDWDYCRYLVIQPSPLDPALINTSYETCIEVFLMNTFTTSFFLIPLSHSIGQTKTSTSPCIQGVIYEVLTVWRQEKEFCQQWVFQHQVLWKLVELLDTLDSPCKHYWWTELLHCIT